MQSSKLEAIASIFRDHPDAFFVFSNGITARHGAVVCPIDQGLFLLHAMGEALPVGLGFARAMGSQLVVVVEGDGNAQMGSASWLLEWPDNLLHYVLEDGEFETTGGQELPTVSWPSRTRRVLVVSGPPDSPIPPAPGKNLMAIQSRFRRKERE